MAVNILVTGGSGFIGSSLGTALKAQGHTVRIFDRIYHDDVTNPLFLSHAVKESDIVYHLAALTTIEDSISHPEDYYHTNITGTATVLHACTVHKKKLIYTSSAAVYDGSSSPYARSKALAELFVSLYASFLPTVVLRLFNVYGPGMKTTTMLSRFQTESPVTIYGTGKQTRDFIHIDDVTDILIAALDSSWSGKTMDVGTGKPRSVLSVAQQFGKPIQYREKRSEVNDSVADISTLLSLYKKPFHLLNDYIDRCSKP